MGAPFFGWFSDNVAKPTITAHYAVIVATKATSEFNPHRKLDHPWSVHLAGNFPEIRVSDAGVDSSKPDMIENVEGVTLKSQPQVLTDLEIPPNTDVLVN